MLQLRNWDFCLQNETQWVARALKNSEEWALQSCTNCPAAWIFFSVAVFFSVWNQFWLWADWKQGLFALGHSPRQSSCSTRFGDVCFGMGFPEGNQPCLVWRIRFHRITASSGSCSGRKRISIVFNMVMSANKSVWNQRYRLKRHKRRHKRNQNCQACLRLR